ncbi:MAG TPA: amidase [Phenylobacterium sp.]|jgi:amidase|uniref:amidase n=1 Tax=Phenylobacterium sp. TaxID=1871053 RepID=UPI002D0BCC19|nr:amidase [Phenylobacterium sp.]HXA37925.1 amidase [Phenylobacterium sp.]
MTRITRRALAAVPLALAATRAVAAPKPPPVAPAPVSPWPDATETAARVRRGEVSAAEVVEAAIARAEALQGTLNVIVNSDFDRALAKARAGTPAGPFGGVPFLVKDLVDYRGLPTRSGSQSGRYAPIATNQAPNCDAFDRAGFVTLGKSATPEFGFLPTTEPVATGVTRNPWDLTRSSGGSSGGSSVAVAAGIVPVAHATDGGGSIRIPASHCGLFGLKPSRGRIVDFEGKAGITDVGVEHVVSRTVRDSAALFALTEDTALRASFPPVGLVSGPAKRRLRVGVLLENGLGHSPTPEVVAATDHATKLVAGLGHRIDYTHLPYDGGQFIQDFLLLWANGALGFANRLAPVLGRAPDARDLEAFSLGLVEMARRAGPQAFGAALQRLGANALAYDTWFPAHQFDVVLSPVLSSGPPRLGEVGPLVPFDSLIGRLTEYVGYTPIHNLAGAPAMSVPLYWTEAGLPIGTMFAARAGNERMLFELAYELEAASPWAQRIPPVRV